MSVARLRLAPVGETTFPVLPPFFQKQCIQENRPVPLVALPALRSEVGP